MSEKLTALHTANAGVLLNIGRNAIGIDLFSRDPERVYPDTPENLKEALLRKISQGEIQTLLFTHEHGDHFCLEDVREALRRNPELRIISTAEVIRRLREAEGYAGSMYVIAPGEKENRSIDLPGFQLELFSSRHMGEQYAGVQNLTCMLAVRGKRLVIPGDAWPEAALFERIGRWSTHIDWFLAPFPVIGLPSSRRLLCKSLKIEQILAFHLPCPEADDQHWLANAKKVCENAKDGLPVPLFGEKLGQEYCLDDI